MFDQTQMKLWIQTAEQAWYAPSIFDTAVQTKTLPIKHEIKMNVLNSLFRCLMGDMWTFATDAVPRGRMGLREKYIKIPVRTKFRSHQSRKGILFVTADFCFFTFSLKRRKEKTIKESKL